MSVESLKISIAQRVLNIVNTSILEQIDQLLIQKNIIGYDVEGNPISEQEYIADLNRINSDIDSGNTVLYSSKEVKQRIIDANNLV